MNKNQSDVAVQSTGNDQHTALAVENPPDPARTIEGLRDTGYRFETAIADIIDNSIAAEATTVDLKASMDFRGNIRVSIADNGIGMSRDGLIKAMRYGSPERPDPSSLGKFGMGLKTASTAFCRKLSVTSRPSGDAPPQRATWDLDHVVHAGKWELLLSDPPDEDLNHLEEIAPDHSGAVVVWEEVDRLLKLYSSPGGKHAQNALNRYVDNLRDHVAMVYQRFLDPGDSRAPTIAITINGEKVEAWNPFFEQEAELVASPDPIAVEFEDRDGIAGEFAVRAFVLPRREEFSTDDEAKRARIGNEYQGVYVYRENRLIYGPDWLGIYQKEPHGSLLRVEFSFDHRLDEAFHVDIKKSQISLNEDLYNWLSSDFLPAPRRAADERYRQGRKKKAQEKAAGGAHDSSNRTISNREKDVDQAKVEVLNEETGEVEITNSGGRVRMKLRLSTATKPGEVHVQPVEELEDGMLWSPALIDRHQGVSVNTGHPYYRKVYIPNLSSGVTVQGMDSLLWALGVAELKATNEATHRHFKDLRYEISRILRLLVEDLPEPKELDDQE